MQVRSTNFAALLVCLCFCLTAQAQSDTEKARALFNAGAQAYSAGKYPAAISAFQEAYRLSKREGLLFSVAQSYRRQYFIDRHPENLQAAIDHYRRYLQAAPTGNRRGEAADALAQLEPMIAQLTEQEGSSNEPPPAATQLMITSPTPQARLTLDGSDRGFLPFISEVEPGQRKVELRAPGHQPYVRSVQVKKGSIVPLDIELVEKPAIVAVTAPAGARIAVNGRYVGEAPLAPISLEPGRYTLSVAKNGREMFARVLNLEHDSWQDVEANPRRTKQRKVSWITMGLGGGALVSAGVLGTIAMVHQRDAKSIRDARGYEVLTSEELEWYEWDRQDRDKFRTAAVATGGGGVALLAVGLAMHSFDQPRLRQEDFPVPAEREPTDRDEPAGGMQMEVSLGVLPNGGTAVLGGRF